MGLKFCEKHEYHYDTDTVANCPDCDEGQDIESDGLVEKMRAYANDGKHNIPPQNRADLVALAFTLEQAVAGKNPVAILPAWVAARKYWCMITGEPLV